jgi:hypothetical protein
MMTSSTKIFVVSGDMNQNQQNLDELSELWTSINGPSFVFFLYTISGLINYLMY